MLELIAKRGRALVSARCVLIMLRDGDELVVVGERGDGESARPGAGCRSRVAYGRGIRAGRWSGWRRCRIACASARPRHSAWTTPRTALLVPMMYHAARSGCSRRSIEAPEHPFTSADEECCERSRRRRRTRRDQPQRRGGPAAQHNRCRRGRTPALGAGASRRDPAGTRRPARAARLRAAAQRPGRPLGGDEPGDRATSSTRSRTCERSSRTCGRRCWTTSGCSRRSKR